MFQVNVEEPCLVNCAPATENHDQLEVNFSKCPESPVSAAQQDADTQESQDTSRDTGEEEEEAGSDSSSLPIEETSVLTNGELSEEEEDLMDRKSILPSSVLDQASVIAECFIGSLSRRSSLVSDDLGSLACPSPSRENDVFKSPSACMDLEKQTQEMLTHSTPVPEATSEAKFSTLAHGPCAIMEREHRSTLSKQDRLLIHKIRRYYEHAEDQDANFSIKRRESLSYIPAGLVRYLSKQLNGIQEQVAPVHRKGLSRNRPTSWSVFDLPGLVKTLTTEEEFRPSSDMLKVWQHMEIEEENQEVQQPEEKVDESRLEATEDNRLDSKTSRPTTQILEEPEICTASDCSSPTVEEESEQDSKTSRTPVSQENSPNNRGQLPKIISFRTSMDEDQILQDMGKMKNKVFQLARQYSQRIKNNRPIVWQRNRETANQQGSKSMSTVHEEKPQLRKKGFCVFFCFLCVYIYAGKPNMRLPSVASDQIVIHEMHSPSPAQTPSSGSSQSTVICPQSPQSETFYWPDVQELRSKYTEPLHSAKGAHSGAIGMFECCTNMYNGCSHKCNSSSDLRKALTDCPSTQSQRCPVVEDWPKCQSQPRLQPLLYRWSSLDHMLGSRPLHEVQNLQEPVRGPYTTDILRQDGLNRAAKSAAVSSGKTSESNVVKSLREKFQNLSTSS
uniref:Uncharacterized protein n=1 Tax=Echeneis naucrates TaxID=173247 RepID=A0A665UWZ6_ECHNA